MCLKRRILAIAMAAAALSLPAGCKNTVQNDEGAIQNGGSTEQDSGSAKQECRMDIAEETVCIEGLEGEYTLLFVTDTHAVVRDGHAGEAVEEYGEQRYPMFVNAEGVDSKTQLEAFIRYANEQKVDGVLLGGDIIDSPSGANIAWLGEQLGLLEMPYLYVPGNHDWTFPWDYMTETGKETYLPMLEPFMQENTAVHSLDFGEFVVVGIDNSANQVNEAALPELERLYAEDRPVLVTAHVPFLTQSVLSHAREVWDSGVVIGGGNYGGIYPDEYSEQFVRMLTAADSPAELVLTGHVHFYDRDVIEGEKDVLQLVGGAGYEGNVILIHVKGRDE